jgi:hypothetical protein
VVFTDVLIVGRLDVHGQSFAPICLHKIDAASDWLLIKRFYTGCILEFLEKVTKEVDRGKPFDIRFLDFAKAFDKVL